MSSHCSRRTGGRNGRGGRICGHCSWSRRPTPPDRTSRRCHRRGPVRCRSRRRRGPPGSGCRLAGPSHRSPRPSPTSRHRRHRGPLSTVSCSLVGACLASRRGPCRGGRRDRLGTRRDRPGGRHCRRPCPTSRATHPNRSHPSGGLCRRGGVSRRYPFHLRSPPRYLGPSNIPLRRW